MYRNKKDVDKHVESLISKLSTKEFNTRAYSVARLYFEVGDYASCKQYVEQYLTQKDNNAAAYKLFGQALQLLGQKEKALEQYKTSLNIDPTQTSAILDICELLADDEITIDPGRANYWCEKAEATFPRHPVTFKLREKLVTISNPDPEALLKLIKAELAIRPKDAMLHARLLKHYLQTNQIKEAIDHAACVEFGRNTFINNYSWYETLVDLINHNSDHINDWLYQLILLTVRERICVLSLTETPSGSSKSLIESNDLLHAYDQALETVSKAGAPPGFAHFHTSLLQHHRGQLAFHAATFLLKKAKKDQLSWRDGTKFAAPLMLMAWHTLPMDPKVNWLTHAPEKQQQAAHRWYSEGAYRCSQSGHYLLSNIQDKSQTLLDRISQCCSGTHWRDKLYEKIFTGRGHLAKIKSSHMVSNAFSAPILRLPRRIEVETYDTNGQREYANSLHHFVWSLMNYKNYAHFKCSLFDMLIPTASTCGPETLNKLDMHAFLYCAALTAQQQKCSQKPYVPNDKPTLLPANITDLLCSLSQMKWWDCAYKFSHNELGTELTDIRATLSRGIEVIRCIDNHGLDPELLCILGRIFSEKAKLTTAVDEKTSLEIRASLYYSSAIPLLEKLKCKITVKFSEKRMFDYTHKELNTKDLISLIEECKLFVAVNHLNDCEYDKVVEILSNLKSTQAYVYLSQTYKKIASEENYTSRDGNETKSKCTALLYKARNYAYKALDCLKNEESFKDNPLYNNTQLLIEDIETDLYKIDPELSHNTVKDVDGKYSSDENVSLPGIEFNPTRGNSIFRNLSSTPKQARNSNVTSYRTAVDSHILESTRTDQQLFDKIEHEIKNLQKRDSAMSDFMEQTKCWFDENRKLGNQIITTIHSNMQNTTDQFKQLKISVDHVKDQIDECRNECKDVGDLKKQIAELKKEVNKLKKASSEQTIDESDLYNLDDDYRASESTSTFAPQLPFTPPQVMPPFNQRLVPPFPMPPNPYQLYGQNLYNLYNQYSQFAQTAQVPGAPPLFDHARAQMNYPGVYPTPEHVYLEVSQLVSQNMPPPTVTAVPPVATIPTVPSVPVVPITVPPPAVVPTVPVVTSKPATLDSKEITRSLPVNVVITSSDPLPTCTTAPAPVLSVTIPQKHIKGTAHNYQIPMPPTNEAKIITPPIFSFPSTGSKPSGTTVSPFTGWNQSNVFKAQTPFVPTAANDSTDSILNTYKSGDNVIDNSISVVDGLFSNSSPNTSLNKSRTLSERSNTSVENYDPCPDFKPIIPLPAEVKVTTGEEDEALIFSSRAKLFRFVEKQWKERGIGEIKLLKHKISGKVRVLMRREQIHKICANHIITSEMEIKPMKNETKAYFWVANDFADETVVLEKFCVRFKTADIAHQFYEVFEKARQESLKSLNSKADNIVGMTPSKINAIELSTLVKKTNDSSTIQPPKAVVGGFTFSSTPTFKPVDEDSKNEMVDAEPAGTKINVFSSLTFKTNASSPFSNIFSTSGNQITNSDNSSISLPNKEAASKLNNSDTVEEFEPNVEFKPVIPLPALVDQKTGEENETVLFEHRAKLLRFDAAKKEWKERGLGSMKLLVHKENIQKVRLLMRREQIMKVCCNHTVTKEMVFQKMPNMDKAVTWGAKDFSEGELISETFCLRFKTAQTCDEFMDAVKLAQSKIKDESKAAKEEQNAAKQGFQIGFGDAFKPKAGSWHCDTCYTNNLEQFHKCACCEQPKPQSSANENSTSKDSSIGLKSLIKLTSDDTPKFTFGIPPQTAIIANTKGAISISAVPLATSWGDKFKPKEGTWECKECFVRNESDMVICSACSSAKDPNSNAQESKSLFGLSTAGPKFSFGIPSAPTSEHNVTLTCTSPTRPATIFDGTGAHKFSFGITPTAQDNPSNAFGVQKSNVTFGTSKVASEEKEPINFSNTKSDDDTIKPSVTATKSPLLPTPKMDTAAGTLGKGSGSFDFVFKPKTPPKGKSPEKSPKSPIGKGGEDSDGNEYASEDEGHHIHFSPVIPMPDKVDVVTGEENEIELYAYRSKLFRFISGEWKERGIGVVKILKHRDTNKLRVVMRREQVLKICLNHALTSDIIYTPKDDKTWLFAANDFSEGELSLQRFCLRFKTKEVAMEFKDAVDKARGGKNVSGHIKDLDSNIKETTEFDDVIFVNEIQATAEEKAKAKELMLPENFFTYKNKQPCSGCRGCSDEEDSQTNSTSVKESLVAAYSTPAKLSTFTFHSPASSLYGTPMNLDRTLDNSMFRTPLGSIGSNTKITTPAINSNVAGHDAADKENAFTQKSSIFSGLSQQTNIFNTPLAKSSNIFNNDTPPKSSSMLAAPKLNTVNTLSDEKQIVDPKSIFSHANQANTIFSSNNNSTSVFGTGNAGTSINNKSIFGSSVVANPIEKVNEKTEVKSIFGITNQEPVNHFSNTNQDSIFGPGALKNNQVLSGSSLFGNTTSVFSTTAQNSAFSGKSIFGMVANPTSQWNIGSNNEMKRTEDAVSDGSSDKKADGVETGVDIPFKVDNNLSFAALSSAGSGFQKKDNFQWEGAGQQLFGSAQKGGGKDAEESTNEGDGANDTTPSAGGDEEYDPHYEPIVPLPEKIVVTTGEEDEEKLFGERCKLYRYDDKTHEWKERGVGEMKILRHLEKNSYRFLLRREQVHKAVLNMLLFMDLELLPMKNSDRAWTWAGRNYAESSGQHETLAVRFKTTALANTFHSKVVECVRKLQAAAAEAIREQEETSEKPIETIAPLRLPKHLADSARADTAMSTNTAEMVASSERDSSFQETKPNGETKTQAVTEVVKQIRFREPEQEPDEEPEEEPEEEEEDEEDNDEDGYDHKDYEGYYNEDDEESGLYYACDGEVVVRQNNIETLCEHGHLQVLYDQDIYSPKILVTDSATGEILADMLIYTDTEFQMSGETCSWAGTDYTSHDPVYKSVTVNFHDSQTALMFYDSCETSKASTYPSTDRES